MYMAMNRRAIDRSVSIESGLITVMAAGGAQRRLHNVWLRDNCPCSQCKHPTTGERLLFTADIAADLQAKSAELCPNGDLRVTWLEAAGRHESVYSADWLAVHSLLVKPAPLVSTEVALWRSASFELKRVDWQALMSSDEAALQWCNTMAADGVAAIDNVPSDDGEVERVATRLGHVRETAYDRLHNVRSEPSAYNVASTPVELKTHTDMPNYSLPPGVQLLHFVQNAASGGETTLTDGFAVACDMATLFPKAFRVLCDTSVSFRMTSKKADIVGTSRLVTLGSDGAIELVRFSNQLQQPLRVAHEQLDAFYNAYREYSQRMVSPKYMVNFRTPSGTIICTHNHRVLHGRTRFDPNSGPRHLQLSYMDFDDVLSRRRILRQGINHA
jgi:gamma-butyrobetaine dioxygenase